MPSPSPQPEDVDQWTIVEDCDSSWDELSAVQSSSLNQTSSITNAGPQLVLVDYVPTTDEATMPSKEQDYWNSLRKQENAFVCQHSSDLTLAQWSCVLQAKYKLPEPYPHSYCSFCCAAAFYDKDIDNISNDGLRLLTRNNPKSNYSSEGLAQLKATVLATIPRCVPPDFGDAPSDYGAEEWDAAKCRGQQKRATHETFSPRKSKPPRRRSEDRYKRCSRYTKRNDLLELG